MGFKDETRRTSWYRWIRSNYDYDENEEFSEDLGFRILREAKLEDFYAWRRSRLAATYATFLESPKWQEVRSQVLRRDGYRCRFCRSEHELVVHHTRYDRGWDNPNICLTLCSDCHSKVHRKMER